MPPYGAQAWNDNARYHRRRRRRRDGTVRQNEPTASSRDDDVSDAARRPSARRLPSAQRQRSSTRSKGSLVLWATLGLLVALVSITRAVTPLSRGGKEDLEIATEADLAATRLRRDVGQQDLEDFFALQPRDNVKRAAYVLFCMSDVSHLERDLRAVQASCDLDAQNRGQNPYLFTGVADARRSYALAQAHGVVSFPSIVLFTRGPGKSLVLESELVQGSVDGLSAPYLIELVNRKVGSVAQIWKVETIVTALQINTYDIFVENPTSATVAVLCCGGSVSESAVTDGLARLAARRNLETLRLAVASDPLLCERFQITPGVAAAIYYGFGSAKRPVLVASTEHAASADALVHDLEVFLDDVNSASKANPGIDDANTAHLDVGKIDDACDVE